MREIADIELAIQGGTEKIESLGEQGKVEESMREMAAIEALKSEKAEKMVRGLLCIPSMVIKIFFSKNLKTYQTLLERQVTRSYVSAISAALISLYLTQTDVSLTTLVARYDDFFSSFRQSAY